MEAQPALVLAARNGTSGHGPTAVVIEHGEDRFAVIITGMGMGNAEADGQHPSTGQDLP